MACGVGRPVYVGSMHHLNRFNAFHYVVVGMCLPLVAIFGMVMNAANVFVFTR